jgi:hypothetical protein
MLFSLDALKAAARESDAPPQSVRVEEGLLTMGGGPDLFTAPLIQIDAPAPPAQVSKGFSRGPHMAAPGIPDAFEPPKQSGKGWIVGLLALAILGGGGFFAYTNFVKPEAATATTSLVPTQAAPEATPVQTAEPVETAAPEETSAEPTASAAPASEPASPSKSPSSNEGSSSREPSGSTDRGSSDTRGDKSPSSGSGSSDGEKDEEKDKEEDKASNAPPFSTDAARSALSAAASKAASCKTSDGPTGSGKVQVTFVNSGRVTSANVVSGPFGGTSVGGCIARTFRQARVPAFSGDPQIVAKSFKIPD